MLGTQKAPLLDVKNLKTYYYTEDGVVKAVDGIDLRVYPGEIVGVGGGLGCGKSVTSLSIMRLISKPGRIDEGDNTWFRTEKPAGFAGAKCGICVVT